MKWLKLFHRVLLTAIVYPFSYLARRDRNLWIFGSSKGQFNDNSKYLFLWLNEYHPSITCVWMADTNNLASSLTENGYRSFHKNSLKGIWLQLRAGVYVYSYSLMDTGFALSGKAIKANLWHGVGVKSIEFKINSGPLAKYYKNRVLNIFRLITPEKYIRPTLFVCPSKLMEEHFRQCFRIDESRCLRAGYPRLTFHSDEKIMRRVLEIDKVEIFQNLVNGFANVVLYMPTWRDSACAGIATALSDLVKLNRVLASTNSVLLIKAHPAEKYILSDNFSNIKIWPKDLDIYPFLPQVNCLVTDYSSILYDYLMVGGRHVILYVYDYDEYMLKSRDFAYPYLENTVGVKATNFEILCETLVQTPKCPEFEAANLIQKFWGYVEGDPCKKIYDEIHVRL